MKVAEIRKLLAGRSDQELRELAVELYKILPKKRREEKAVDDLVRDLAAWKKARRRKRRKAAEPPDVQALKAEVQTFISNARNHYYYTPNSVVPKRERPKWRFVAKRLIKDLTAAAADPEQLPEAAEQLEELYALLCLSCRRVLFSAYEPFDSVGIEQTELFDRVLTLHQKVLPPREFVSHGLTLALGHGLNRWTLYSHLMRVVLEHLRTPALKELALEECTARLNRLEPPDPGKKPWASPNRERREVAQNLAEMGFRLLMELAEDERAVEYFRHHYRQDQAEVKLFVLLELLYEYKAQELWLLEYERAVADGVEPRRVLQEGYEALEETGEWPERWG